MKNNMFGVNWKLYYSLKEKEIKEKHKKIKKELQEFIIDIILNIPEENYQGWGDEVYTSDRNIKILSYMKI